MIRKLNRDHSRLRNSRHHPNGVSAEEPNPETRAFWQSGVNHVCNHRWDCWFLCRCCTAVAVCKKENCRSGLTPVAAETEGRRNTVGFGSCGNLVTLSWCDTPLSRGSIPETRIEPYRSKSVKQAALPKLCRKSNIGSRYELIFVQRKYRCRLYTRKPIVRCKWIETLWNGILTWSKVYFIRFSFQSSSTPNLCGGVYGHTKHEEIQISSFVELNLISHECEVILG